ncbi:hypothetical protein Fmac_025085 [Flemingia macrophylla]|uniref:Uncharacterized protein n=1 Tax=Flemingia macrophylla TaxID=520843 RepID=A0ABD1LR76_9FABA
MAGLQQYNFFPTDFFYPRSHPSQDNASVKPMVVPMQTPKEDSKQQQPQQQRSRMIIVPPLPSHALVSTPKRNPHLTRNYPTTQSKPLSWPLVGQRGKG